MKKRVTLIIFLLLIFINKVQALEDEASFSDFSKNEIMVSSNNYLVVGNIEKDFNSIQYFTNSYCEKNLGKNYTSKQVKINKNVAYSFCRKIDYMDEFTLTKIERSCYRYFFQSLDVLFNKECRNVNIDFKTMQEKIKVYTDELDKLSSQRFIYEVINEDLALKIENFEAKALNHQQQNKIDVDLIRNDKFLQKKLGDIKNPTNKEIDAFMVNRNIEVCKLYGFIDGSELYFECLLELIRNAKFQQR